jgi:hypothetical protein
MAFTFGMINNVFSVYALYRKDCHSSIYDDLKQESYENMHSVSTLFIMVRLANFFLETPIFVTTLTKEIR